MLTSVLQACYPCPSYGNNNHPSLCHRKWRQLCFLPTRLIYGLLATLDHWHPQHWQPNWHHQDHHEHDEHCDRPSVETANCSGRCNCDFTLFSIFKLKLNQKLVTIVLTRPRGPKVHQSGWFAWLCSYGQFVPGVIYGHDTSMQMMACEKYPTIISVVIIK